MKGKNIIFVFIVIAIIIGVIGVWFFQRNSYSRESLKLEILGPSEVELAEEIEYVVKYKNNGNIRLEKPKLIFEYPLNSLPTGEENSLRIEKDLDDIYPGEERTFSFRARLLGKLNEAVIAKAWLSYQPKNLSARYESSTTLSTVIKSVPFTFEFDIPSRVGAVNEIKLRLNYFSNVDYPLSDLRVQVDYPEDFEYLGSNPTGLDKNEWEIPVLNKADGGRIEVTGKLNGQIGENKTFKARIGVWHNDVFILLKEAVRAVALAEPSLYISQQINGNPEYVAAPGNQLHFQISFKNIGDKPLVNLFLISRLESSVLDLTTLKSDLGRIEPGDNSVAFESENVSSLRFLDTGEEGNVEFWVKVKDNLDPNDPTAKNASIKNKVVLSQAQEEFTTKVASKLEINQKGFYQDEVFGNTGPVSPKVGEVTTYTITWQAKNLYNDVKNARVKATLPQEVRLTGEIFPEEQKTKFAFDSQSREIVWELGDLTAGTGISSPAPNISFQIALAPTDSQRGKLAELINGAQISGEDSWAEQTLTATSSAIDSSLADDQSVDENTGRVQ